MLSLLGITYFTDSIITAMTERNEQRAYMVYHTDCLYMISSALGNKPGRRFFDIINPAPKDKRTDNETLDERLERFGIKVVD